MSFSTRGFRELLRRLLRPRLTSDTQRSRHSQFAIAFEGLEDRQLLTVSVSPYYCNGTNSLSVSGDGANDSITISLSSGLVQVNAANVVCADTAANVQAANVQSISISDSGGTNTIDLSSVSTSGFSSLADGSVTVSGGSGDDTITGPSNIGSTISGGNGHDSLSAGGAADSMSGGDGNDTLLSSLGNDSLSGNGGNDAYWFSGSTTGSDTVTEGSGGGTDLLDFSSMGTACNINLSTNTGSCGGDLSLTLSSGSQIENVTGSAGADTITGNAVRNVIEGGSGNDSIYAGEGDDVIRGYLGDDSTDGGDGSDTYIYDGGVSMGTDTVVEPGGGDDYLGDVLDFSGTAGSTPLVIDLGDTEQDGLVGIVNLRLTSATGLEGVVGTSLNDDITANKANNILWGLAGDDTYRFVGYDGLGSDTISDGSGNDVIDFSGLEQSSYGGVTFNIGTTSSQSVRSDLSLTLWSGTTIDRIVGTSFADSLTGNSADNTIVGGAGNDTILGAGGNDSLIGGTGADEAYGGSGDDTLWGGDDGQSGSGDTLIGDEGNDFINGSGPS